VAGEALVRFRGAPRAGDLIAVGGAENLETLAPVGRAGLYRVRSRSLNAAALMARLARRADVLYAEPNYIVTFAAAPNDPLFPSLWGLENLGQPIAGLPGVPGADIGATAAWDVSTGSPNTVVAVIDSGVDYTHEDLAANMWSAPAAFSVNIGGQVVTCAAGTHGFNAITQTCDPMDDHNHGTHVAGTIGAVGNNQRGVVGVNWTTRIMGIKFLNADGSGSLADAINGIRFAIEAKQAFAASDGANVRILSNSWGGAPFSQALLDEINAANQADMLFVVAAGNSALNNDIVPTYPASFAAANQVTVAATTNFDTRAWFSNYGASSVHLGAPGDSILSTTIGNTYASFSGTSMAAPHVSGAAALLLSVCDLDTAALKDALTGTVDALPALTTRTITGGRLNVHSAVHSCLAAPPAPQHLVAAAGDNRVVLTWSASLGATRYIVKRSTASGGPYAVLASNVKGATYADTTAVNDTTYYYVVAAANSLGDSDDSNEASATPRAPSDLRVSWTGTLPPTGAGTSIEVTVTTRNHGAGAAPATTTSLYLSTNGVLSNPGNQPLADMAIGPLAPTESITATLTVTIPGDVATDIYYLLGAADAAQVATESSETNNTFARLLKVGPDLEVSALTVPLTAAPGASVSVTSAVENEGGGGAGAFSVTFYLSSNSTLDAGDTALGSRAIAGLAAGATNTASTTLTIPASTAVGTYQLIAKADASDEVVETGETNNTRVKTIQVGGDLVVSSLSAPSMAGAGGTISVTDTTRNQGSGMVAASTTRFYLSSNSTFDGSDVLLNGGHSVPELQPTGTSTATVSLVVPGTTVSGSYYLLAVADADGVAAETLESNNTTSRSIQIGTDLVLSALTVPSRGAAGGSITVADTTKNQGASVAPASLTRFYLSANSLLDTNDVALAPDHTVPALSPGVTHSASVTVTIPANTATGTYYVIAKADAAGSVVETQESNNTLARSIDIGGDLSVTSFAAPSKGGAGRTISVSETTVNQGAGMVASSVTRFYLSANTILDASDTLLPGARSVPSLDTGASSTGTTTITIPANTATGAYFLIAKADGDNGINESQESNNTANRGLQVGPDLIVSTVSIPSESAAGSSIVVTETTTNQGGGDSDGATVAFYLSANTTLDASDTNLGATRTVPPLAAGAASTGQTSMTIPAGTPGGLYYVIARVDPAGVIAETQEGNNNGSDSTRIGPDLSVSSLSASPSTTPAGATVNLNNTVVNSGAAAAAASTVRFYLSTNLTLDAADTFLTERAVPPLGVNDSSSAGTPIQIPAGTAAGNYYVLARADATGVVTESNESNNVTSDGIQVTIVP
jgi:subtilisin family serine protease/uncharacterized membrane protein